MTRFISILILVFLIGGAFTAALPAQAAEEGKSFASAEVYTQKESYKNAPVTFEAWIKLSTTHNGRGGVILGNFDKNPNLNFEIYDGGAPRLYINGASYIFSSVKVNTGDWVHLAIVYDSGASSLRCYLNGELAQTLACNHSGTLPNSHPQVLGGDSRGGNPQFFKGEIREVAVFSEVRTEAEIKADSQKIVASDALLAHYKPGEQTEDGVIRDLSGNGNDCALPNYIPEFSEDLGGMIFKADKIYRANDVCEEAPNTFEAVVYFSNSISPSTRGGIILGNYGNSKCSLSFEVYSNGTPRLYYTNDNAEIVVDTKFNDVNLFDGNWNHIAIVRDTQDRTLKFYLNGALKQTVPCTYSENLNIAVPMCFGGDYRSGNDCYFKGAVKMAAMYEDARSAEQIKTDSELALGGAIDYMDDGNCISLYDAVEYSDKSIIPDLSRNSFDLEQKKTWFDQKDPVEDYAYSFAVIGDTQIVASSYPDKFHKIYDYILDNIEEKNIQFVFGMGDITDRNSAQEWAVAIENISRLDGKVDYSLVRGNHDGKNEYNSYVSSTAHKNALGGSFDGILNTWQTLTVGEIKYLIFGLDYGASDEVLNWASAVIEAHPSHNVIITTHAYLYRDGTTLDQGDVCPPATSGGYNNGDHMWDKLIKKHENIVLVMSGHDPCDNVIMTQAEGENGNTVTQMLVDGQGVDAAQGAAGLIAMLYFSEDGRNVTVEYYSTIKEQYFMSDSQFSFELDVVGAENDDPDGDPDDDPDGDDGKETEKPTESKETDAPEATVGSDTPDATEAPKKSGCGASTASVSILLTSLLGAAVLVNKAKKRP